MAFSLKRIGPLSKFLASLKFEKLIDEIKERLKDEKISIYYCNGPDWFGSSR